MKLKTAKIHLAAIIATAAIFAASGAMAGTIANWTFETSLPATAGPFSPEVGAGSATGFHAGTTTYSSPAGNGSAHSFSSNGWAVGDYYQFQVATTGESMVGFQFDQISSSTGPRDFKLQYSTDGSTFLDSGFTYAVIVNSSPNNWNSTTPVPLSSYTVDLSSISALDNQAAIYLRLVNTSTTSANNGTVASTGTSRVDNVIISTVTVPEPCSVLLAFCGLAGLGIARRR